MSLNLSLPLVFVQLSADQVWNIVRSCYRWDGFAVVDDMKAVEQRRYAMEGDDTFLLTIVAW